MQCTALCIAYTYTLLECRALPTCAPGQRQSTGTGSLYLPERSRDNDGPSIAEAKPHQGSVHARLGFLVPRVPFSGQNWVRCVPRACWARPAVGRWRQARQALAGGRAGCRARVPLVRSVYGAVLGTECCALSQQRRCLSGERGGERPVSIWDMMDNNNVLSSNKANTASQLYGSRSLGTLMAAGEDFRSMQPPMERALVRATSSRQVRTGLVRLMEDGLKSLLYLSCRSMSGLVQNHRLYSVLPADTALFFFCLQTAAHGSSQHGHLQGKVFRYMYLFLVGPRCNLHVSAARVSLG
jgi:hypothetical protein